MRLTNVGLKRSTFDATEATSHLLLLWGMLLAGGRIVSIVIAYICVVITSLSGHLSRLF